MYVPLAVHHPKYRASFATGIKTYNFDIKFVFIRVHKEKLWITFG
jgi:hypothetical protein